MGDATSAERAVAIVAVIGIAVVACYRMWKNFLRGPLTPDPWGPEIARELETSDSEGVCLHCLSEQPHGAWFCPHCGASTGPYNTLNPFLGAFVEGEVLRQGTAVPQPFTAKRIFAYAFLGLGAYQAFLPLLPFYWWALAHNVARSRRKGASASAADAPTANAGEVQSASERFRELKQVMLLAFHKPYGVLSQFTPNASKYRTLVEFGFPPRVYPIGRLDADSEGLLLLSNEPGLNTRLLDPKHGHSRIYWAQVERVPTPEALAKLSRGVVLQGRHTLPCRTWLLDPQPQVPPREPPIRFRKNVPDCWLALDLIEGKNRQVRRMTAAVGHPTLRLIRVQIGEFRLVDLQPGQWRELSAAERDAVLA